MPIVEMDWEDLIRRLKLPLADLYLFGDGSGTTADKPCASACIAYDTKCKQYSIVTSGYNHGTNNFAELMPYIHALWLYEYKFKRVNRFWNYNASVEIVSDSELTVKQGNNEYNRAHGPNAMLWEAIEWFNRNGYKIHWNHVSRNSNGINAMCDLLAGEIRKKLLTVNEPSVKIEA